MREGRKVQVPWTEIDDLLLDMDGTLLDLAFDNHFWLEVVPGHFARDRSLDHETARGEIERRYAAVVGTLPWYCLDHWTEQLGLDIRALKRDHSHLIRFLPQTTAFLDAVRARVGRLILVTNAHRAALEIKLAATGLGDWMDEIVSSHDFRAPKEDGRFWTELVRHSGVDPGRSVLIEDSLAVLETARGFGVAHTIAIRRPDSRHGPRDTGDFAAIDGVGELI